MQSSWNQPTRLHTVHLTQKGLTSSLGCRALWEVRQQKVEAACSLVHTLCAKLQTPQLHGFPTGASSSTGPRLKPSSPSPSSPSRAPYSPLTTPPLPPSLHLNGRSTDFPGGPLLPWVSRPLPRGYSACNVLCFVFLC